MCDAIFTYAACVVNHFIFKRVQSTWPRAPCRGSPPVRPGHITGKGLPKKKARPGPNFDYSAQHKGIPEKTRQRRKELAQSQT